MGVRTRVGVGTAGLLLLVAFVLLGLWVRGPTPAVDRSLSHTVEGLRSPALTGLVQALNLVLTPALAWLVALVLAALAAYRGWQRRWGSLRCALITLCGFVLVWRAVVAVKIVIDRPRPPSATALTPVSGFSYPSGHVSAVVAVATLAVLAAWWKHWHRRWVLLGAVLAAVIASFDRVYLGAHYPTDVLGAALGTVGGGLLLAAAGAGRWCRTPTPA